MYIGVHSDRDPGCPASRAHGTCTENRAPGPLHALFRIFGQTTQYFLWFLPRLISLTVMAEENPQPQTSGEQPSQAPSQQAPGTPQSQGSGQRRNDRRDRPRHRGGRRDFHRHDQQQPSRPAYPKKQEDSPGKDEDNEDEEEHDRTSPQQRHHRRGGRPPKKIIEEWANDPYCE